MSWNFLDVFDVVLNGLELLGSGSRSTSDRKSLNYDEKPGKKESKEIRIFHRESKYSTYCIGCIFFFYCF